MVKARDFGIEPIDDMVAVGQVGPREARIWFRSARPGRVEVVARPASGDGPEVRAAATVPEDGLRDGTESVLLPGEGQAPLAPRTAYDFRVTREDGRELGAGRFETFPEGPGDAPEEFSFAVMSCHQPFRKRGGVRKGAAAMLRALGTALDRHRVRYVLMLGDQMYADLPKRLSLFDAEWFHRVAPDVSGSILDLPRERIRRLYQDRYRRFLAVPGLREIERRYPCLPIIDDHDIIDNWGSDPAHEFPPWRTLGDAALDAAFDYQGSRVIDPSGERPPDSHFRFAFGDTATFVMDLRSDRRKGSDGRLVSPRQREAFETFLADHRERAVLFVVLSVPAVHLPRGLTKLAAKMSVSGEDFSDRWSTGRQAMDRDWLLRLLHDHLREDPSRRIVLLSGDIHIGCAHEIAWRPDGHSFLQFVSSAVTNRESRLMRSASKWLIRANGRVAMIEGDLEADVRLVPGANGAAKNPMTGMNFGIVTVRAPAGAERADVVFRLYGERGGEPVLAFESAAS